MAKAKSHLNLFVALLRGVNVGGNSMISMSALKKSFETIGFTHVSTYINSGNVIFNAKETDARKLEQKIERMLVKEYELNSKVVVRSLSEMERLRTTTFELSSYSFTSIRSIFCSNLRASVSFALKITFPLLI